MQKTRLILSIAAGLILVGGIGVITYFGRPVMQIADQPTGDQSQQTTTGTGEMAYAMSDVSAHASEASCWSAINGSVYDLTSWISRHPGGPEAIVGLCGSDGSSAFTQQHGRSGRAQSALALLKIGSLK